MTSELKKRKLMQEHRGFKNEWTEKYFFISHKSNALCLICMCTSKVIKEYNIKRHYLTNHVKYEELAGDIRKNKIQQLKKNVNGQQQNLVQAVVKDEAGVRSSYKVAMLIAKHGRPFTDSEFVKECLVAVSEEICPDLTRKFEDLSLSARTCVRRTEELGEFFCMYNVPTIT